MNSYLEIYENIKPDWLKFLKSEFSLDKNKDVLRNLFLFLEKQAKEQKTIYPEKKDIFKSLNQTSLHDVKVVILGQDPYHGPGQAHGLSFSVPNQIKRPPSLVNIYKELSNDLGISISDSGDLTNWANQGVLLLNSVLTVEQSKPGSHQGKGWEVFTDIIIKTINEKKDNVVFILWGSYAQKKANFVNKEKHLILESAHPSPLSSYRGFFGSKPFSKTNEYLKNKGLTEINWKI